MEFSERYLGRNDNKYHEIKAGKTKDRQIDRYTDIYTDRYTDRFKDRYRYRYRPL